MEPITTFSGKTFLSLPCDCCLSLWATSCRFGTSPPVSYICYMFLFGTLGNQELWLSCICSKGFPEIVSIITFIITANKSNICRI